MAYLKDNIMSDDKKIQKLIQVKKDHFQLEKDITTNKL